MVDPFPGEGALSPLIGLLTEAPLVGRGAELGFLRDQFQAVVASEGGRLVLIAGEPGAGKTRLAREVGRFARDQGARFLEGRYLRDGTAAYGPWVEALRPAVRDLPGPELAGLIDPYGADLAQVVPDLVAAAGPFAPPPALPPEESRRRLFDGFAELIVGLSRVRPIVILLDDLQWAPGLDLLSHVVRRLGPAPILLLGTFRDQELAEHPALARDRAELNRQRLAGEIPLKRLTGAETAELVGHYFGQPVASQLASAIYRRTGGNAFFTEEVVRTLADAGAIRPGDRGWEVADAERVAIPDSMRLAVEERVDRLGAAAQEVLAQAAVLGQEFGFGVLLATTGRAEDDLSDLIDRAVAARIVVESPGSSGDRFAFLDDQVQEVLYGALPPLRRRGYHSRAGQALENVGAEHLESYVEELARHFAAGGDHVKTVLYADQAAAKNDRLLNRPRAAHFSDLAVSAIDHLPDTTENRRRWIDAVLHWSAVVWVHHEPDPVLTRLRRAESLARGLLTRSPGDRTDPITSGYDEAVPCSDYLRVAKVYFWLGRLLNIEGDRRASQAYHEQAIEWARRAGDSDFEALAVGNLGIRLWIQGYVGRALPLLSQAVDHLHLHDDVFDWLLTVGPLNMCKVMTGDCEHGLVDQENALLRALGTGDPRVQAISNIHVATVALLIGNYRRSHRASQTAARVAEECGDTVNVYRALGLRAWAESRLGQVPVAISSLLRMKQLGQQLGSRPLYSDWYAAAEAEMALSRGRPAEARSLARAAVDYARSVGGLFAEGLAQRTWGQALAASEPSARGDVDVHLAESLRCFEEGGVALEAARTRLVWARLCRERGDIVGARAHADRAIALFEGFRLAEELDHARSVRDQLPRGSRSNRDGETPAGSPAGLTAREREVLRLIAAGRTNQEIADALVISRPTAERHVANIYAKIGARGRAETIAFALRQGLADQPLQ